MKAINIFAIAFILASGVAKAVPVTIGFEGVVTRDYNYKTKIEDALIGSSFIGTFIIDVQGRSVASRQMTGESQLGILQGQSIAAYSGSGCEKFENNACTQFVTYNQNRPVVLSASMIGKFGNFSIDLNNMGAYTFSTVEHQRWTLPGGSVFSTESIYNFGTSTEFYEGQQKTGTYWKYFDMRMEGDDPAIFGAGKQNIFNDFSNLAEVIDIAKAWYTNVWFDNQYRVCDVTGQCAADNDRAAQLYVSGELTKFFYVSSEGDSEIPEPNSIVLLMLGITALLARYRKVHNRPD